AGARGVLRRLPVADSTDRSLISAAQLNRHRVAYRVVLTLIVVIFTLIFIGPLYFLFSDGLKSTQEAVQVPPTLVPAHVHPGSYTAAWSRVGLGRLLVVPQYVTIADLPLLHLNLIGSPEAIWLPSVANAFNIFLLKRFFDSIP